MAFLASINTNHGLLIDGAYYRVTRFDVEFPEYIEIQVDVFPDRDARLANRVPLHRYSMQVSAAEVDAAVMAGGSLLAGLYALVKVGHPGSADV